MALREVEATFETGTVDIQRNFKSLEQSEALKKEVLL